MSFPRPRFAGVLDDGPSYESPAVELVSIFSRRRKLFLLMFVLVLGVGTALVFAQTRIYTATASILFDPRTRQIFNFTPVVSEFSEDNQTLEIEAATELQLVLSQRVIDPVIANMNLEHDEELARASRGPLRTALDMVRHRISHYGWSFGRGWGTLRAGSMKVDARQNVLKAFADRLKAELQGHSTVIDIAFSSKNAEKAAAIANAVAASYVQLSVTDKTAAVQEALTALTRRSVELRDQTDAAESAVEIYRASAHLVAGTGGSVVSTQVTEFSSQLVQAEADLAAAQARAAPGNDPASSAADAAVLASPVIQQLRIAIAEATSRLARDQSIYGHNDPALQSDISGLTALRQQIGSVTANTWQEERKAVATAQARVDLLKAQLAAVWNQAAKDGLANVHLRQLELAASVQHDLYQSYLRRIQEVSQQLGTAQPYAEVISAAEIPATPTSPNIRLLLPAVFLVSLALASAAVVFAELFSKSFQSHRQIERVFGDPPVEMVPRLPRHLTRSLLRVRSLGKDARRFGPYAEAIDALRVRLRNLNVEDKTILFSSAVAGEGKTTLAVAFARQEAIAGNNVLIIDADMRRPSLHRIFSGRREGLTDLLRGQRSFHDVVQYDKLTGLAYLAAGTKGGSPIDLLGGAAMQDLLRDVEKRFDRIIMDSPPVLAVADARVLAALANWTVYLVRWRSTPRRLAWLGLEVLRESGGKVLGPIFVQVDGASTPYGARKYLPRIIG